MKGCNFFPGVGTLPETNSEFTPENGWLEDDCFLLGQKACFQGRAVSFREGTFYTKNDLFLHQTLVIIYPSSSRLLKVNVLKLGDRSCVFS